MVWNKGWRDRAWNEIDREWDLIIIGGGITGVGVLRQAVDAGLSALLVEAHDFGSGTSSRSSKLVHGGLRYLRTAQLRLTLESVREREYLLDQGRGLITRLGFLYTRQQWDHMPGWIFGLGLCTYDIMARQWQHRAYDALDMQELCPPLTSPTLRGGYRFFDAQTDDARLVLRLLYDSIQMGGLALNYTRVVDLIRTSSGRVGGVIIKDTSGDSDRSAELNARVVINATGVWVDELRQKIDRQSKMRPLRGSHLVISPDRLPIKRAVTFLHPRDGRPVFALPWEGVILFGTTDLDHNQELLTDPAISAEEVDYLLSALKKVFPAQELSSRDIIATFSGLRPVVNTGKRDPSKESREYAVWDENGLITVSGGKLTTFRLMARAALKKAGKYLDTKRFDHQSPTLNALPEEIHALQLSKYYSPLQHLRLLGRYSPEMLVRMAKEDQNSHEIIPGTPYSWAELKLIAGTEAVVHLEDLLLRRLRLGLLVPRGGEDLIKKIGETVRPELGWSQSRWEKEVAAYNQLIRTAYQPH